MKISKEFYRGCLLGGAVGDALGYTVEFMSMEDIQDKYGINGIQNLEPDGSTGVALISDDTQMTAFTADGVLYGDYRARTKGVYAYTQAIFYAYQVWFRTQTGRFADPIYSERTRTCKILKWEELMNKRAPNPTCLTALEGSIKGKYGTLKNRINASIGNGGIKRAAPIGMYFYNNPKQAFQIGCETAALTYGSEEGFLPAGTFAALIAYLIQGDEVQKALERAMYLLEERDGCEPVMEKLEQAANLAKSGTKAYEGIVQLGTGSTGTEALAMGVFAALSAPENFADAVRIAVNHGGDSDCIGSVCGNIMGISRGFHDIPYEWIHNVEVDDLMVDLADQLLEATARE